jgi:hypothetical protein
MQMPRPRRPVRAVIVAIALLLIVGGVPAAMVAMRGDTPPSAPGQNVPVPTAGSTTAAPGGDSQSRPAGTVDPDYWDEDRMREAPGATMPADG